jgi:hypothetical protein
MATEENQLSARESLDIIADVISKTRENFSDNSFFFLLCGWLIVIASLSFFVLLQFTGFDHYFIVFPILTAIGIILTIVYILKRKTTSVTETYLNYFLNRMWIVLGIGFVVAIIVNVSNNADPCTDTLLVAGIGTLISGLVMHFKPLIVGGILLLAAAMITAYIPYNYKPLIYGIGFILGYIIPGYLLKNSNL